MDFSKFKDVKFPSLTGVIRFLIKTTEKTDKTTPTKTFPSLTGVIRFLMNFKRFKNLNVNIVSVPYRGYSFFNPTLQNPHGYWAQNAFCGAKLFLIGNR